VAYSCIHSVSPNSCNYYTKGCGIDICVCPRHPPQIRGATKRNISFSQGPSSTSALVGTTDSPTLDNSYRIIFRDSFNRKYCGIRVITSLGIVRITPSLCSNISRISSRARTQWPLRSDGITLPLIIPNIKRRYGDSGYGHVIN